MSILSKYSDEELIGTFKRYDCCLSRMERGMGLTKNTVLREFNRRSICSSDIAKEFSISRIEEYNKNPKLCEHCGKPLPWEKRNQRFCDNSCAASENNKGVVRNSKERSESERAKIKIEVYDKNSAHRHNNLLKQKYPTLNINPINPGCCPICGEYHCNNEFCKKHNFQQLLGYVDHLGFDPTTIGTNRVFEEFERVKKILYEAYWIQNKSFPEILIEFKYTSLGTLFKIFESFEIPRRGASESLENALLNGRYNLPEVNISTGLSKNIKQDWHTTWTGDEVFLRSSYELDYANYLDENQISYSVEDLRIEYYDSQQNKTRVAIPDFYLPNTNEIVEIKSDFTLDIQEMLDKFEAYKQLGYGVKLILEKEEVDIYSIESTISTDRLDKIKNRGIQRT